MNGFSDKEIIGALVAVLVASYAAFFARVAASINRLDWKIHEAENNLNARIETLDAKLSTKIDTVDARLSTRLDALTIAVARLEGSMWGRTPSEPPRKAEKSAGNPPLTSSRAVAAPPILTARLIHPAESYSPRGPADRIHRFSGNPIPRMLRVE